MPIGSNILAGASGQATGYDIDQSLRFEEDDASKLSRTFTSAGNRKTWTLSTWVKLSGLDTTDHGELFNGYDSGSDTGFTAVYWINGKLKVAGWSTFWRETSQEFRDPSAWYHLVVAFDTTQASADDRCKIYVNGSQVTDFDTNNALSQNTDYGINGAWVHQIGQDNSASSSRNFSGYMAEFHFIDGQALTPASFGETDSATQQWKPIEVTGLTYGNNGFYLKFQDSSALGDDSSGNNNDFTSSGLAATDVMTGESPTNNFATLNPLFKGYQTPQYSEGNLKYTEGSSSAGYSGFPASISVSSGKWYFETYLIALNNSFIGIIDTGNMPYQDSLMNVTGALTYFVDDGRKRIDGVTSSYASASSVGDIVGVALNMDDSEITFYKNNSSLGTISFSGGITSAASVVPIWIMYSSGSGVANFGQDSSFAGNYSPSTTYTDANGNGSFVYDPGSYLALCTDNLPDPSIADPTAHFNTVTYSGTGASQTIAVGFQPDLVWAKCRNTAVNHVLYDSVRGTGRLESNNTNAEGSRDGFAGFDSNGFDVDSDGGGGGINYPSGRTYVAWNWKAGGTAVSNTDGTITSSVSANTTAGFSIVSWTGDTTSATIGHGLSQAPELIIIKSRDGPTGSYNWPSYSKPTGTGGYINLDQTNAWASNAGFYGTAPTASVFSPGSHSYVSGAFDFIAYCFHSVDGYSKVGSYTGNGSSDGTFVYTGFRPVYVMWKRTDSADNWTIEDSARNTYNGVNWTLEADTNSAEWNDANFRYDFLSNGFKHRNSFAQNNASGGAYIYLAFAESPFKYSRGR